jgi:hypothetical protein
VMPRVPTICEACRRPEITEEVERERWEAEGGRP